MKTYWIRYSANFASENNRRQALRRSEDMEDSNVWGEVGRYGLFGLFLLFGLLRSYRGRGFAALRHAMIWLGLAFGLMTLYAYRLMFKNVVSTVMAELDPSAPVREAGGPLRVRIASDGHFHLEAKVNGVKRRFLVDTGASGVVLSGDLAKEAGIRPDSGGGIILNTANGSVRAATATADLETGGLHFPAMRVYVSMAEETPVVLGMSFLAKFARYESDGVTLTLYPKPGE